MAAFAHLLLPLLIAFTASPSSANWCVCKDGGDAILQKTLDYACGAGADCNPVRQGASCFQPNTVRAHCSYAANSYFQKKGQQPQACDFAGTATVTSSDPSSSGCVYPSSASGGGTASPTPVTGNTTPSVGSTTPSTGTPSTSTGTGTGMGTGTSTTGSGTSTTGSTPFGSTPGVLGGMGMGTGLGPSGVGVNNDESHGGLRLMDSTALFTSFFLTLFSAFTFFLWG